MSAPFSCGNANDLLQDVHGRHGPIPSIGRDTSTGINASGPVGGCEEAAEISAQAARCVVDAQEALQCEDHSGRCSRRHLCRKVGDARLIPWLLPGRLVPLCPLHDEVEDELWLIGGAVAPEQGAQVGDAADSTHVIHVVALAEVEALEELDEARHVMLGHDGELCEIEEAEAGKCMPILGAVRAHTEIAAIHDVKVVVLQDVEEWVEVGLEGAQLLLSVDGAPKGMAEVPVIPVLPNSTLNMPVGS